MSEDEDTAPDAAGVSSEEAVEESTDGDDGAAATEPESERTAEDASDETAVPGPAEDADLIPETAEDIDDILEQAGEYDEELASRISAIVEQARDLGETVTHQREELADLHERVDSQAETIDDLHADLEETTHELEDVTSRLKRKQADFQNYKKRAKKRQDQIKERATEDLVERLLGVRDNLKRALGEEHADVESLRDGVNMTLREFDRVLEDENVAEIDPEPGTAVDPQRHEVMMQVDSDQPEGTIADVYTAGYEMGEKVIQSAQVTVSNGERADETVSESDEGEDVIELGNGEDTEDPSLESESPTE